MKKNRPALFALLLVQLFYGVTYTFANDVIDGGYMQPYGFILFRVALAAVLFWVFSLWTPKEKIDRTALYALSDAVKIIKENANTKFDETIDIAQDVVGRCCDQ